MKQTLGATALLAVAVAAVRIPAGSPVPQNEAAAPTAAPAPAHRGEPDGSTSLPTSIQYQGGCSVFDEPTKSQAAASYPKDANVGAARSTIDSFFGPGGATTLRGVKGVRYAVALVPDPRHTNLSLWFDREIVAIQQAAQDEGFAYNSSWLPWKAEAETYARVEDQQRADDEREERESCPGLLLFRAGVGGSGKEAEPYGKALVVLLVGEQPTGGLNETQWANAISWLNRNAYVSEAPEPEAKGTVPPVRAAPPPALSILGPSFSGSLVSLERDLEERLPAQLSGKERIFPTKESRVNILSGSVSSCGSIRWLQQRLSDTKFGGRIVFGSFEENDELRIDRFLNYLSQQGYRSKADAGNSDVAILSEDETAYAAGASLSPGQASGTAPGPGSGDGGERDPCAFPYSPANQPLRLAYPRDISAVRNAYEKQSLFSGHSADHSTHLVLQENAATGTATATDTVSAFSGAMSAVQQEAVLYGIVSSLRSHHSRFVLLRCTNSLDFLFLMRFFQRAYPEGRIVTVSSDLLFGREIDSSEFRGVLSISNYPLLPRNQHWSHIAEDLAAKDDTARSAAAREAAAHTHRIFDSHLQGAYLAARYLFDGLPLRAPSATGATEGLILRFKPELPDFAVPFWLEEQPLIKAPTWISVVGRDGYWPLAVLDEVTTPPHEGLERLSGDDARKNAGKVGPPPSTLVAIEGKVHHDLSGDRPPKFSHNILFNVPLPLEMSVFCSFVLLAYQLFGICLGYRFTSIGLFALFRRNLTYSHAILLGANSGFAVAVVTQLLWVAITPGDAFVSGLDTFKWFTGITGAVLAVSIAVTIFFFKHTPHRRDGGRLSAEERRKEHLVTSGLALLFFVLVLALLTIAPYAFFYRYQERSNGIPLFYRISHLFSGVSPLVPVLLLVLGFYLWTWQALAGSSLMCSGHPRLPRLRGVVRVGASLSSRYLRAMGVRAPMKARLLSGLLSRYLVALGVDTSATAEDGSELLTRSEYRISGEMEKRIMKAAAPLSLQARVLAVPILLLFVALWYFHADGAPLLSLESQTFANWINCFLLFAFLLTTAEAGRLFFTWIELRRLLTALNRQRLRRTFAKLRAISTGSLWSVSGNVQRVQYLFFSQQLDAANRLARMVSFAHPLSQECEAQLARLGWPDCPRIAQAVDAGRAFASRTSEELNSGPRWEEPVEVSNESKYPALRGLRRFLVRDVLNDAVGEAINEVLLPSWRKERESLNTQTRRAGPDEAERNAAEMKLSREPAVRAAEEFVCLHYIAFIQNVMARMRTMILSMISLFMSVCLAISFYPFVPRTQIALWMLINLALIAAVVIYVYAGMEHDETLSYITNSSAARLSKDFYIKTAAFLAGPLLGLLTTQFPAISESVLSWLQPAFDAVK